MIGWGEITAPEEPFYHAETTETARPIFKAFIVPALLGKSVQHAAEIQGLLASIRGHPKKLDPGLVCWNAAALS